MGYRAHTGLFQGVIRAAKTPMMWGTARILCGWHCAEGEENIDSLKSNKPTVKVGEKSRQRALVISFGLVQVFLVQQYRMFSFILTLDHKLSKGLGAYWRVPHVSAAS